MEKAVLSWSGGKDAAYALYEVQKERSIEVVELLTTISAETGRSTMHGVRKGLLDRQSERTEIPIRYVELPENPSNREYEDIMSGVLEEYESRGVEGMIFADIFLEDVRKYREEQLSPTSVEGYWPLWRRDTSELINDFLDAGFRTTVVCVDGDALDESFVGRELDGGFVKDLPDGVDPCGENGEFHTFVWSGPIYDRPIKIRKGDKVTKTVDDTTLHYCDILENA
ncbi:MAG: ATP-binding protein [Halobacteria archaeon]|nr:ATP-binding protein [Halobacteria archaeon]